MNDESYHTLDVSDDAEWDRRAADVMARAIAEAVAQRGRCLVALSGGSSPAKAFTLLGRRDLPWSEVTILQVDERIAPLDSGDRNLVEQKNALGATGARWLPLPVDELLDLDWDDETAASAAVDDALARFSDALIALGGEPPVLDLIHLGLGVDGHTASLFPGDRLTDDLRSYVGLAQPSGLRRRLSMTRACLDRARMAVWLVSGSEKAPMLERLMRGDRSIPAGLVRPAQSVVLADRSAARTLPR